MSNDREVFEDLERQDRFYRENQPAMGTPAMSWNERWELLDRDLEHPDEKLRHLQHVHRELQALRKPEGDWRTLVTALAIGLLLLAAIWFLA